MRTRACFLTLLASSLQLSALPLQAGPGGAATSITGGAGWSIAKPPDPWVASTWRPGPDCTAFAVTTRDAAAGGLKIYSNLVEQSTKRAITQADLRLCRLGEPCAGTKPIDLPPNTTANLELCTTSAFHGTYHGVVALASQQKPDGDSILQAAQFSSFYAKLTGCLLILAGVYLAWWSKVWSRARIERDQALMPAVFMRSQLAALQETLAQLRPAYRQVPIDVGHAIEALLGELADAVLDGSNFLPPTFPNPYGYTVNAAGYKAYLEARNARIQLLAILVNDGVVAATAEDDGNLTPAQQAQVTTAVQAIDAIAAAAPPPGIDQARPEVAQLVADLHGQLFPVRAMVAADDAAASPPQTAAQEYEVLKLDVVSVSKGIWILYGILTALSGLAVLILNNPGFGVPLDFVFVFFWGFGLPTTVQALTPGSAGSALNISIAKS
jgi:hypothetical protein